MTEYVNTRKKTMPVVITNDARQHDSDEERRTRAEWVIKTLLNVCREWTQKYLLLGEYDQFLDHNCALSACESDHLTITSYLIEKEVVTVHGNVRWDKTEHRHICYIVDTVDETNTHRRATVCHEPHLHAKDVTTNLHIRLREEWVENECYVCRMTGIEHLCGDLCEHGRNIDHHSKIATCPISGRAYSTMTKLEHRFSEEDRTWKDGQRLFNKTISHPNSQCNIRIQTWCRQLMCMQTSDDVIAFTQAWVKPNSHTDVKKAYKMVGISRIWILLCDKTLDGIASANRMARHVGIEQIQTKIDKFRRDTNKYNNGKLLGQPPTLNLAKLAMSYQRIISRSGAPEPVQRDWAISFMVSNAQLCMKVWQVLWKNNCNFGVKQNLNGFAEFVIPCLYMLKDGLKVDGQESEGTAEIVFSEHKDLGKVLPDHDTITHIRNANVNIQWTLQGKISRAVSDAICRQFKSVVDFEIQNLTYESLQMCYFPARMLRRHTPTTPQELNGALVTKRAVSDHRALRS